MTTKNKPQCGFCGRCDGFDFQEDIIDDWMWVGCDHCDMWMQVSKANARLSPYEEPNRSTAIKRYAEHTKRLAMMMLKNDAAKIV